MINIMIDIRYISRCVIHIFKSVRFILHEPSSDYSFSSLHVKNLTCTMDSGPVRLMTIAHAFKYRVAVLRDGVRSAVRVGRSRKAEKCFLTDVNISWGQKVAVMFQIVSTLMEEVPDFALRMQELRGEQP